MEAAEVLARNLNARDLVVAVLGDAALVDYIFCRGGLPTACAAAPACKEWSVLAKAAIARWQRVCSSAWSRAGIRDEREWVGSYTDDGDAGDAGWARRSKTSTAFLCVARACSMRASQSRRGRDWLFIAKPDDSPRSSVRREASMSLDSAVEGSAV